MMTTSMTCKICNLRRPRRHCPAVAGEICSVCCGKEREVSLTCPFDCEYLLEARLRDKPPEVDPKTIPNLDIDVPESFLREHEVLLGMLMRVVADAALGTEYAVDNDVRQALDAITRTYRTRESGLYYDSRPDNLVAAALVDRINKGIEEYRKASVERLGMETLRDSQILGMLVFLQRVEYQVNNGRKKGRAFIQFVSEQLRDVPGVQQQSKLIVS